MKKVVSLFVAGLLSLLPLNVFAIPVVLEDTTVFTTSDAVDSLTNKSDLNSYGSGDVNYLQTSLAQAYAGNFDYVSWTHNYDFDSNFDYVTGGILSLNIVDDVDSGFLTAEYAFGFAEDGTWGFGEVDSATYNFDITAAFLADGMFEVTLASVPGDFYLDSSVLTVFYETSANVAEPSALAIMGIGLILLGFVHIGRKKFATKLVEV